VLAGVLSGVAATIQFRDESYSDPGFSCDASMFVRSEKMRQMRKVRVDVYRRFDGLWRVQYLSTERGFIWLNDVTGDELRTLVTTQGMTVDLTPRLDYDSKRTLKINKTDKALLLVKLDEWEEKGLLQS